MKFSTVFAPLALATTAVAGWGKWDPTCLTDADVQSIIDREVIFLEHKDQVAARAAAESLFVPTFNEYGDSINSLRGAPLGTIVEPDAATYINNTLSAPGATDIQTYELIYNCRDISWRWAFYGIGNGKNPRINGYTTIKTNTDKLVYYHYVEFNSLAWAENLNFTVLPPTTGPFAPPQSKVRRDFKA